MYSLYTFFVRLCGRSHFFGTGADLIMLINVVN